MNLEILLSGLIGAILASVFSIIYQEIKVKRERKYFLAKERLGKIYGPLLLILESNKKEKDSNKFLFLESEIPKIDEILFNNYYLIEEKKRRILISLYSHKKFSKGGDNDKIVEAIKEGFIENKKIIEGSLG